MPSARLLFILAFALLPVSCKKRLPDSGSGVQSADEPSSIESTPRTFTISSDSLGANGAGYYLTALDMLKFDGKAACDGNAFALISRERVTIKIICSKYAGKGNTLLEKINNKLKNVSVFMSSLVMGSSYVSTLELVRSVNSEARPNGNTFVGCDGGCFFHAENGICTYGMNQPSPSNRPDLPISRYSASSDCALSKTGLVPARDQAPIGGSPEISAAALKTAFGIQSIVRPTLVAYFKDENSVLASVIIGASDNASMVGTDLWLNWK